MRERKRAVFAIFFNRDFLCIILLGVHRASFVTCCLVLISQNCWPLYFQIILLPMIFFLSLLGLQLHVFLDHLILSQKP